MKKFALLFFALVVCFAVVACTSDDDAAFSDGGGSEEISDAPRSDDDTDGDEGTRLLEAVTGTELADQAMVLFFEELMQRIETTPLHTFPLLVEALEHGTTNFNFNYSDSWSNVAANMSLISNAKNMDFALRGDIAADGINIDFSAYINDERLAFSSSLLDGEYYGVVYETMAQDFAGLSGELGIDVAEFEQLASFMADYMEWINSIDEEAMEAELVKLSEAFMAAGEQPIREENGITIIPYTVTPQRAAGFIRDIMNTVYSDDMLAIFNHPMYADMGMTSADIRREIDNMINAMLFIFEAVQGEITVSFHVNDNGRLIKLSAVGVLSSEGAETVEMDYGFTFGTNATDNWTFYMDATTDTGETINIFSDWDINTNGGRNVHEISLSIDGEKLGALISDWDPSSGDFIFSLAQPGSTEEFFRGNATVSGNTFSLLFAHEDESNNFTIAISTERGANIGNVNFTNLGTLSMDELQAIMENASTKLMENMMAGFDMSAFGDFSEFDDVDWESVDWENFDWSQFE